MTTNSFSREGLMQEIVVDASKLHDFARSLCEKAGLSSEHAAQMAKLQVQTDLRGVHSHGTRALPGYLNQVLDGNLNPKPDLRIVSEGPSFAVVDGDNGMGHLASTLAMETAIAKAKITGVAAVGVHNAGHFGAAACYSIMAVENRMIGFSTTNTGRPSIVAPGGAEAVVGNSAMSYALPTGNGHPIVLDMACGVSSWGKIGTLRMYGKPIPEGWLLDDSGQPSSDPNQGGLMAPAAGPRGYGLALIMGILAGPLTGGMMSCNKNSTSSEHFFIAINIESFTDYDAYISDVKQGISKIHGAKTAEGFTQVYLPGEIEWNNYDKWIESGIPIHVDHLRNLESIAEKLDINIFWEW